VEFLWRFLIGGTVVSIFALLADVVRPKRLAGLFSAAPSVALATLALALWQGEREQVVIGARSMALAALAFVAYALTVERLLIGGRRAALSVSVAVLALWSVLALAGYLALRGWPA
jgi:uncharacterized membrane protein (GlpM family)